MMKKISKAMRKEEVMEYMDVIDLLWDEEAGVWVATSEEISGLVLEDSSFERLIERVKVAAEDLRASEEIDAFRKDGNYAYKFYNKKICNKR